MKKILSILIALCIAVSMYAAETTIAGWSNASMAKNTAIKAASGDSNNKGTATVESSIALSSKGTNAYYTSSGGGCEILFKNLTLTGYSSINLTFYSRASQKGTITVSTSSNGTSYTTLSTTAATTTSEKTYTINSIPNDAKYIKLKYNGTSGSFYFGTPTIKGTVASCTAPTITTQPQGATYTQGASATALSIFASGSSVTYQWYKNSTNSTSGATSISGATSSSYTPSTASTGTTYYYCVASSSTCTTTSSIVAVTVNAAAPVVPTITAISDLFTTATSTGTTAKDIKLTLNNWVVTAVTDANAGTKNVFVTDGTNGFIINGTSTGFAVGDRLSGTAVACQVKQDANKNTIVTGLSTSNVTATAGGSVEPIETAISALNSGLYTGSIRTVTGIFHVDYATSHNYLVDGDDYIWLGNTILDPYSLVEDGAQYTVTGVYWMNGTVTNASQRVMPRSDADIRDDRWTITWSVNGNTGVVAASKFNPGAAISFPDAAAVGEVDCNGKVFVGWSDKSSVNPSTGDLVTSATATGNKTYYAVFATSEAGGGISTKTITIADETVTPDGDSWGWTNDVYSFTSAKGTTGTAPTINSTDKDVRLYANNTFKIETTGGNITKVVFNISTQGKKRLSPITASVGNIATQASGDETVTWTGDASEITFTVGEKADYGSDGSTKAGQLDFGSFEITSSGGASYSDYSTECVAPTCDNKYTFSYWTGSEEATKLCFEQVGETNEYQITDFTVPTTTSYQYWVGYNNYFYDSNLGSAGAKSVTTDMKYLPIANLQPRNCEGSGDSYKHAATGAYGTLRIYSNYSDNNLYVGFIPAGYQMRVGSGETWSNIQMTESSSNVWESGVVELTAELQAKNYYVNVWTSGSYSSSDAGVAINNWTNGNATIGSGKKKTGAGDNWADLSASDNGTQGKFRMWADNCANNGYLHFVPYYNVTFKRGETVLSTTELKSCEVANVVNMTAPSVGSEETFDGWYEDAELTVKYNEATYDASANGSKTFYAKITTKTYSITLNAGSGTVEGEESKVLELAKGAQTLPVAAPCPTAEAEGWSFAGWATASVATQTATKPSGLIEPEDGSCAYTVAGAAEYFAVYQKTESGVPSGEFKLSLVNDGTTYYVGPISSAQQKYFLAKTSAAEGVVFGVDGSKIYYWNNSTKVYIKCNDGSSVVSETSANASEWTITETETTFSATRKISTSDRYIGFNYNNGSTPRFAAYTDSYSHVLTKHDVMGENTVYCSSLSCETTYAITVNSAEGGAPKSDKTRAAENATVTLTPAADECHDFVSWKVYKTGDESTTVTVTSNQFTMPAYDVTVEATYSAKTYTITLHEGTTTTVVSDLVCGATYDFPALSADCSAKVNGLGWTKTTPKGDKTWDSEPASVVTSITVSETADYYAVYAEDDDSGAGTYMPTTTITDGGRYLIVYTDEPKAMKSNYGNNGFGETSLTSGLGSMLSGATANEVWVFKKESNSKYSIRNLSSGKYVGSDAQGLTLSNDVQAVWSITANSSCATITTGDAYVVYNTGAYPFTGHHSNSNNIKLYTTTSAAQTYSNVNPCADYHTITITSPLHGTVETTPQNKAKDGETITITSTPATHYTVTSVAVAADCETVEVTDGAFTMPDCDVTVTVTFTEKTLYTVTLVDEMHNTTIPNGHGTQTGYEGEGTKVAFESLSDQVVTDDQKVNGTCKEKHYHFVGWILSTEELADDGSNVIRATRKDVVITGDATYKAVWAERVND